MSSMVRNQLPTCKGFSKQIITKTSQPRYMVLMVSVFTFLTGFSADGSSNRFSHVYADTIIWSKMEGIKSLQIETLAENYPGRMNASEIVQDFKQSLNPDNFCIKGCELHQTLVCYAEENIEPVGWQAVWRCNSKTNPILKAKLNSPSLVEVANVDYESLEAVIELVDNKNESKQEIVLLTELHPLAFQENSAVNIETTHNALQKIRFFYQHLLLPWDSDIQENWMEIHLPVRVQMFCELRSGMLNQEIVARYNFLLSEAEDVERKLQFMAENIKDSDEEMEETVVGNITDLNSKLEQIQQDVEILLNPSTRMLLFGSKVTRMKKDDQPEVLLVVQGKSCLDLHKILNKIESEFSPDLNIRCYPSLQSALDDCRPNDIVMISSGIHSLLNINSLRSGGTLMGIGPREDITVHLGCNSEVGLAFDEGSVTLKNITILVNNKQSGISAKGKLFMENCILRGATPVGGRDETSEGGVETSWKGLYVAPNSEVFLKQCIFTKFDVGIRVRAAGRLRMCSGSEVTACNIGILAEQSANIEIISGELKYCKEFAIGIEMDQNPNEDSLLGGVELLEIVPGTFQIENCRYEGNAFNVKLEY